MWNIDLTGKTALVTGANRGLGQAMSIGLAKAGAKVICVAEETSAETENKIVNLSGTAYSIQANLLEMNSIEYIIKTIKQNGDNVDILINNAGIIMREDILDFPENYWDNVMQINVKILFFLSQAIAKEFMVDNNGKIINIASMLSFQGGVRVPSYTASKHAVAGITKAMANELAERKININAIAPGYMATDNTKALREDPIREKAIVDRIPAGRWGTADDLVGLAVFLSSKYADYINGAIIPVDGGWQAR